MTLSGMLQFRPMIEGDLDAVLAIERESDGAPHWSREQYLDVFMPFDGSVLRRIAMVAETGGVVEGFAVVRLLTAADAVEAELESIVVAGHSRGKGIGIGLLTKMIAMAKADGASRLDLEVRSSNAAALRLYERAGFRETGRRRSYYSDPPEDAVLMSATL